jgi:OmpA-OmpF porin, OOP family
MKKNILASLILSTLIASPVFAGGFYLGADVGRSNVSEKNSIVDFSGNGTTFDIYAGYKFSPYLATEITYRDHGKVSDTVVAYNIPVNTSISAKSITTSLIASYPFTEAFSAYGRLGFASINATVEAKAYRSSYSEDKTTTKAAYGIGAQYALNKNISLRTEYTQYAEDEGTKFSAFTIGANYSF